MDTAVPELQAWLEIDGYFTVSGTAVSSRGHAVRLELPALDLLAALHKCGEPS